MGCEEPRIKPPESSCKGKKNIIVVNKPGLPMDFKKLIITLTIGISLTSVGVVWILYRADPQNKPDTHQDSPASTVHVIVPDTNEAEQEEVSTDLTNTYMEPAVIVAKETIYLQNATVTREEYDQEGRVVRITEQKIVSRDDLENIVTKTSRQADYLYDGDGRLIGSTWTDYEDPEKSGRSELEYDSDGRLLEECYLDGEERLTKMVSYSYDQGKETRYYEEWYDYAWTDEITFWRLRESEYDEHGNCVWKKETENECGYYESDTEEWIPGSYAFINEYTCAYEYDANGNILREESIVVHDTNFFYYNDSNEPITDNQVIVYKYDEAGRLAWDRVTDDEGNTETYYTYFPDGSLAYKEVFRSYTDEVLLRWEQSDHLISLNPAIEYYWYDESGLMLESYCQYFDGSGYRRQYEYDEYGNATSVTDIDIEDENHLRYNYYEYTYDMFGNLTVQSRAGVGVEVMYHYEYEPRE